LSLRTLSWFLSLISVWLCTSSDAFADPKPSVDSSQDNATYSFSISGWLSAQSNNRLVRILAIPEALSYGMADIIWDVADKWTANTIYGGTVHVNMPYDEHAINIYLLNHDYLVKTGHVSLPLCPCSYLPGTRTIFCEDRALNRAITFLDSHTREADEQVGSDKDKNLIIESSRQVRSWHRNFMTEWIIAHEIGHAVYNHNSDDLRLSWTYQGTNIGLDAERQADDFYLQRMQHSDGDQFSAFMGLSQLMTHLYAAEIAKSKSDKINPPLSSPFATSVPVTIPYAPQFHPPLLIRAVTLFHELISRYPNMIDTTKYEERIAAQIHPKLDATQPVVPEFCLATPSDRLINDSLDALSVYADIYTDERSAQWANSVLDRMRNILSPQRGDANDVILNLLEARIENSKIDITKQLDDAKHDIELLPKKTKPLAKLVYDSELAEIGNVPPTSLADLIDDAAKSGSEAFDSKALDIDRDSDRYDALALLLRTDPFDKIHGIDDEINRRGYFLDNTLKLERIGGLRKQHLISLLEREATKPLQLVEDGNKAMIFSSIRALDDLIDTTRRYGYIGKEIFFRGAQISAMRKYDSTQHSLIINREEAIANLLVFVGDYESAVKHQRAALEEISLFDPKAMDETDRLGLEAWKANIQNGLGWVYLKNNQSRNAVQPLEDARQSDEARSHPPERCKKADRDNQRLGSVYQNLADAYLAEGAYQDALKFAILSQVCRESLASLSPNGDNEHESVRRKELFEAMKTRAFVLFALGRVDEAREFARKFVKGFVKLLDYKVVPSDYLVQVVGGQPISLSKIVDLAEATSEDNRGDSVTSQGKAAVISSGKGRPND
jgi:tetratricopeptide (TPR) repeat protein